MEWLGRLVKGRVKEGRKERVRLKSGKVHRMSKEKASKKDAKKEGFGEEEELEGRRGRETKRKEACCIKEGRKAGGAGEGG